MGPVPVGKRALQQMVKLTAAGRDALSHPSPGLVVLIYHRVGTGSGLEVDLPAPLFEAQMAALAETGRVVDLATGLAYLNAGDPNQPYPAPIAVTFDDGTADFVDIALPILARHQLPVTLYAATEFIDEGRSFPNDGRPASWAGLADAVATGLVTIGSHTHRHRLLDRLQPPEVDDELDRSIGLIGDHLGLKVTDFAYPKAVPGSAYADQAVRARFQSAALAGTRANLIGQTDRYRLSRSPVQRSDETRWFLKKADGGLRLEDTLRRGLNRLRYARATA